MIGDRTAEEIKMKIGSAFPLDEEMSMEVRGRDLVMGLPKTVEVTSQEIREALAEPVTAIVERVKGVLEKTPPELSSDIIERGITMTGGGARCAAWTGCWRWRPISMCRWLRTRFPASPSARAARWRSSRRSAKAKTLCCPMERSFAPQKGIQWL